jgi:quinol-cytochrome oxidoreductase complex cytochrome b subunit/mono/diheme cytochrome c family protein
LANRFADWLDARTGYRALLDVALDEHIPGGAHWRYVWGSALSATFLIQLVTGLLLMTSYSPSATTAWGSVYYISYQMFWGWFVRGLHHFGAQAMVVLLVLHLLQVLWAGAYRAPREINWWFGIALMLLTLAFSLTGYLLPWDQKGYWATKVATNIVGGAPVIGPYLQRVIVGGDDYGHQTLTRFYGLHVGFLPLLLILCLLAHVALFRKHGVTAPRNAQGEGRFWPEQLFMDTVASGAVFGVIVLLTLTWGADLDAPADPSSANYPARPEWYFLSLFQMLKLFPGEREVIGTIVVPSAILAVLVALPLLDRILPGTLAHFLACAFVFALIGGAGYLTYAALRDDAANALFQADRRAADQARDRALLLAGSPEAGIPPEGPAYLLLRDPLAHGRKILETKCLGCHYFGGKGVESPGADGLPAMSPQTASDLQDFGSRAWVRGLLENPKSPRYFGKVPQLGGMERWKKSSKLSPKELDAVADFVATFATIPADLSPAEWEQDPKVSAHPGAEAFITECGRCHLVGPSGTLGIEGGEEDAPNLFAWGSPQWITRMIRKPGSPERYEFLDKKDQMPAFADQLTNNDIETLVRYLKNDYVGSPKN